MNNSKISIAVPTHKRANYLRESIESILNQTLKPNEIIISEDGKDMETQRVVEKFQLTNQDVKIIHLINDPPLGQLLNRQQAIKSASGEFVAMLDDDDTWDPRFIEKTYYALSQNADCGFCSSNHYFINHNSLQLINQSKKFADYCGRSSMRTQRYNDVFMRTISNNACIFTLHSTLFRRSTLEKVGFFQTFGNLVPDYALMLSIGANNIAAFFLEDYLGNSRIHDGQQSTKRLENSISQVECLSEIIKQYLPVISRSEKLRVVKKYQSSIIECSIAYLHNKKRNESISNLLNLWKYGFGIPSMKRSIVLIALLFGFKKPHRPIRKETIS